MWLDEDEGNLRKISMINWKTKALNQSKWPTKECKANEDDETHFVELPTLNIKHIWFLFIVCYE